mmetsp:Transcript_83754/g.232117  ORF Transcript_83754/g.232117 Transcript_83754/m.232117 type:complete len:382 (+) Transcript_83754:177-1322(+)
MTPQEDLDFAVGDIVSVEDPKNGSGLHGEVGTLKKDLDRGRWLLQVEGKGKPKLVSREMLRKKAIKGSPSSSRAGHSAPANYSIVGTWDEWEPKEMEWNASSRCFETVVMISDDDGTESFKLLRNGSWDGCVYPDCRDASPYDAHTILGPDGGGFNEEWTIGSHEKDEAHKGERYRIRFFVKENGDPASVSWEPLRERKPVEPEKVRTQEERGVAAQQPALAAQAGIQRPATGYHTQQSKPEEDIVEFERQARERLARRLAAAAEASPLAIEDEEPGPGSPGWALEVADREEVARKAQVEINLQRYRRSNELIRKPEDEVADGVKLMQQAVWPGVGWQELEQIKSVGPESVEIRSDMPAGLRIYLRMARSKLAREVGRENQ